MAIDGGYGWTNGKQCSYNSGASFHINGGVTFDQAPACVYWSPTPLTNTQLQTVAWTGVLTPQEMFSCVPITPTPAADGDQITYIAYFSTPCCDSSCARTFSSINTVTSVDTTDPVVSSFTINNGASEVNTRTVSSS